MMARRLTSAVGEKPASESVDSRSSQAESEYAKRCKENVPPFEGHPVMMMRSRMVRDEPLLRGRCAMSGPLSSNRDEARAHEPLAGGARAMSWPLSANREEARVYRWNVLRRGTAGVRVACASLAMAAACVPIDDRILQPPDAAADTARPNDGGQAANGLSATAADAIATTQDTGPGKGTPSSTDDRGADAGPAGPLHAQADPLIGEAGPPTADPAPAPITSDAAAVVSDAAWSPDVGAADCAPDSVAPVAPVLLSPAIGAYTGSLHADPSIGGSHAPLRPLFTWQSVGGCRVTYDIELDSSCPTSDYRNCSFASPEVRAQDLASTSYQPTTPLPAAALAGQGVGRRYYWRVRACDVRKRCSAWSTTRYVEVGRLRDDVNGDGYSDAVTAAEGSNSPWDALYIYFGGASGDPAHPLDGTCDALIPTVSRPDPPGIYKLPNNRWISLVDVNADGYADILVSDSSYEVSLYLGGPNLATTLPCDGQFTDASALRLMGAGQSNFGYAISATGDLDADGYADFVITAPAWKGGTAPSAQVFFGAKTMSAISASRLSWSNADSEGSSQFGLDAAGVGDWNMDGYPDVIVLSNSQAYWLKGSDTRTGVTANAARLTSFQAHQATRLCRAGDVNGDGFADVAFASGGVHFWIGPGGPKAPDSLLDYTGAEPYTRFFYDCGGDYDTNADGLPDLWLGTAIGGSPYVSSFLGVNPLPPDGSAVPIGEVVRADLGGFLDYNGDGIADIFLGDALAEHKLWLSPLLSTQSALRLTLPASASPLGILAR